MTGIAAARSYSDPFRKFATRPGTDHAELAREAMASGVGVLLRLLDDASPKVVVEVARLLVRLPGTAQHSLPALRARGRKGSRPAADAGAVACVLAVAWLAAADNREWFAGLLGDTAAHADLRAAAAAGLAMAEPGQDPAGRPAGDAVIRLVADVAADRGSALRRIRWHGDGVTPLSTALARAEHLQRAVARDLLARPEPQEIDHALDLAREAIEHWRSAPAELLPMVARLVPDLPAAPPRGRGRLGDCGPLVDAVKLIADAGEAAAAHADLLAGLLTGDPAEPWPDVAGQAVEGLARLGDDRCLPWLIAALQDEHGSDVSIPAVLPAMVAHAEALVPALETFYRLGRNGIQHVECLRALASWGAAAAPLAPMIAEVVTQRYLSIALPLLGAIGPAAAEVVPQIRALLDEDDEHDRHLAAWALWRTTGELGRAPELLVENLARSGGHHAGEVAPMLEDLGPAAGAAVAVLRAYFHDAENGHLFARVEIARALWAITGESDGLAAPLLESVTERPLTDRGFRRPASDLLAVDALGVIGGAEAVPALEAIAHGRARVTSRDVWADERLRRVARRALDRAGSGAGAALTPWWEV
ncbi:hypothetical protein ACBI99_42875 [Nonomuraea sp. ATR24]|uniref:hypothetical protein n=1 Tax=Nonomuraea sp. ATR24 TaxID=1676744 RepID=UPI0035C268C8